MDAEYLENELADFAHQRSPYDTHWMDDRIKVFLKRNIVIPRSELPEVVMSDHGNGYTTALAQEFYQPSLRYSEIDGNKPGEWNRNIAYANLAIAEAIEGAIGGAGAARDHRRNELAAELFNARCYSDLRAGAPAAIDRIIALEDAAK